MQFTGRVHRMCEHCAIYLKLKENIYIRLDFWHKIFRQFKAFDINSGCHHQFTPQDNQFCLCYLQNPINWIEDSYTCPHWYM